MSMLNTAMLTFTLQLWACWLSCNISSIYLLEHASYLTVSACFLMLSFCSFSFLWLEFSHSFSVIFLFDWSHSCIWDFDQIYYHKQLFCFVSCFSWKVSCLSFFSSHFVFLFEISVKSISMSCYQISCSISEKIFCLHSQIFNSEVQISLAFVYNAWKWISQILLAEIW